MKPLSLVVRVTSLAVLHFVLWSLASALFLPADAAPRTPDAALLAGLAIDAVLMASVTAYFVLRADARGPRLAGALFLSLFGVRFFLAQIETAVFPAALGSLPPGVFTGLWLAGFTYLAVFVVAAVRLLGRWHGAATGTPSFPPWSPEEWAVRLAVGAVAYPALYFACGYYVAWQVPEVRQYYSGSTELLGFWAQFASTVAQAPWMPFFQLERGLFWTLLGLPLAALFRRHPKEIPLAVALLFTVVMVSQLLIPGSHMPVQVRVGHLVELSTSGVLHGALVGLLLSRRRAAQPGGRAHALLAPTGG